jgi:hypothetical protein
MTTLHLVDRVQPRLATGLLRITIVGLTLATAAIHASLGGLLFTANALAYATLALAMIVPGPFGQIRWLVRLGIIGFTTATIGGWLLFGARFPLAYLDKGVELALVGAVIIEMWRTDGGPIGVVRQAQRLVARLTGMQTAEGRR